MIAAIFLTLFVAYEVAMRFLCKQRYVSWPWLGAVEGVALILFALSYLAHRFGTEIL